MGLLPIKPAEVLFSYTGPDIGGCITRFFQVPGANPRLFYRICSGHTVPELLPSALERKAHSC